MSLQREPWLEVGSWGPGAALAGLHRGWHAWVFMRVLRSHGGSQTVGAVVRWGLVHLKGTFGRDNKAKETLWEEVGVGWVGP